MEEIVYGIKLITGEEIVTRVKDKGVANTEEWVLDQPVAFMHNGQGIGLGPALISGNIEKPFILKVRAIALYTENIHSDLRTKYIESVSGLVVPSKSILLG